MADLGDKSNPFLAGLRGLGQGLFEGFLTRRKMDEEQRQFNERMAMEERQNSLLMDFRRRDDERLQQQVDQTQMERIKNNQQQDYNTYINAGSNYEIRNQNEFVDGFDKSGNPLPQGAISGDPDNPYLRGKVLIPKSEDQLMTENQRQAKALERRRLDIAEREVKLKELGGGSADFTLSPGETRYVNGKPVASKPSTDKSIDWEAQVETSQSLIDVIDEKLKGMSEDDRIMNSSLIVELEKEKIKELGKLKLSQAKINALKNRQTKKSPTKIKPY